MKVLVAGAGKVGKAVTRELTEEGHDLTLIDRNKKVLEDVMSRYDVITMHGNCASMNTLREAGVEDVDVFIAATDADEVNLLSCVTAKSLNPGVHTIARIRNPEYVDQAYTMQDVFRMALVVNPEKQAANEIARLLKYPGFLKREAFAKAKVEIVELKVGHHSQLANVPLNKLSAKTRSQVLVCAVIRNGNSSIPDGSFVLQEGDRIFVTGAPDQLHDMLTHIGVINMPVSHVAIMGGGRISYYLAEELHKSHIVPTIFEMDEDRCKDLSARLPYATIINADISDRTVLESEDISDYSAVVSLTGMDELNIVTSMYAHAHQVPQIVTKLGRGDESELLDSMPIGSIVCPKDLCTMHIVRYVRAMQAKKGAAKTIHRIADGYAEAIEFEVEDDTRHCGEELRTLKLKKNVLVVSILHGSQPEIASGTSSFTKGDTVVVVTSKDNILLQLNDIFEE